LKRKELAVQSKSATDFEMTSHTTSSSICQPFVDGNGFFCVLPNGAEIVTFDNVVFTKDKAEEPWTSRHCQTLYSSYEAIALSKALCAELSQRSP
jgi:hypothetical protein